MNALLPLELLSGAQALAFRSNFSPEVTVPLHSGPDETASPGTPVDYSALAASAQPTVDAILPDGQRITVFAPYGPATEDYRVYVGGALVAVLGSLLLALIFAYSLGYRRGRRRR